MTGFSLGPAAQAAGYRLFAYDSVDSTSIRAHEAARDGEVGPAWFAALSQSAGKGRRGRAWASPHGNLAASLLLNFEGFMPELATLGFVAGVALADALGDVLGPEVAARVALKWPNDVLVDGKKLSGILLEAHGLGAGRQAVVLGLGTNVVAVPEGLSYAATSLSALGSGARAADLFSALTDRFVPVYAQWDGAKGLSSVLDRWRARAAGLGGPISVAAPAGRIEGIFADIDAQGRLLVRMADRTLVPITAGDVFFGAAAGSSAEN